MPRIKLVTLDLDNTLWPVAEVIIRAEKSASDYLQTRFPELAESLSVPALHKMRDQLVINQAHYWKNLTQLRLDMQIKAMTASGVDLTTAQKEAQNAFDVFYQERNRVCFFPHALDVLTTLGQHYTLGALSNGNANIALIGLADYFDFHLNAEMLGEAKPHRLMFQAALEKAGASATQAVHVGDNPYEDIEGARRAGFGSIWANLLQLNWPPELPAADNHITQLRELPDKVACFND